MPYYHPVSLLTHALLGLTPLLSIVFIVHSWRALFAYRNEQRRRSGYVEPTSILKTPLPLLLRILYATCTTLCFIDQSTIFWASWLIVMPSIMQEDEIHPVPQPDLDSSSRACLFMAKFTPCLYVLIKFLTYVFFFVKQRTVRTLQPKMSNMEKLVLGATMSMWLLIAVGGWLLQGDRSALDGSCIFFIQVYLTSFMAVADATLSGAYLYLFIQPLRETIANNAKTRQTVMARTQSTATAASPTNLQSNHSPMSAARPDAVDPSTATANAASVALELVMRRSTRAAAISVTSGVIFMSCFVASQASNNPYLRKLIGGIGSVDMCIQQACLWLVLHGGRAATAPAPPTGAQVPGADSPPALQPTLVSAQRHSAHSAGSDA